MQRNLPKMTGNAVNQEVVVAKAPAELRSFLRRNPQGGGQGGDGSEDCIL